MADILVKAVSATHPDPEIDRSGAYKKGDIVEVRDSGAPRGSLEGPPTFVIVECPEVTKDQILDRMEAWRTVLDWAVVARSVPQDGWRLRLWNTMAGANVRAPVTRAQVETWLNRWNAAVFSAATNEVVFDVSVYGVVTSSAFWERDVSNLTFSEVSYDTTTGVHRIRLDYSVASAVEGIHPLVRFTVRGRGGTNIVQDEAAYVIEFDIQRTLVTEVFRDALKNALEGVHKRRRFYFTETQVDNAIASGGIVQVTATQLANAVKDAMND